MTAYDDIDDDDVSQELTGQFLNKADFQDGAEHLFTITRVDKKTYEARNGVPGNTRRVLTFEGDKTLSLNQTTLRLLVKWYGSKTRAWIGKPVIVYRDESVMYAGQLTGGWRLRKPAKRSVPAVVEPEGDDEIGLDEVPF